MVAAGPWGEDGRAPPCKLPGRGEEALDSKTKRTSKREEHDGQDKWTGWAHDEGKQGDGKDRRVGEAGGGGMDLPEAPVFYPSWEEFTDPLAYIAA